MRWFVLATKTATAFSLLLILSTNSHSGLTKSSLSSYPGKSYRVHIPTLFATTLKNTLRMLATAICPSTAEQDSTVNPDNHQDKEPKNRRKYHRKRNQNTEAGDNFIDFPDGSKYRKVLDLEIRYGLRLATHKKLPSETAK